VSQYVVGLMIGCYAGDSYSRLARTLNSTFVGIFCSKLATMIECIAVVPSVRNTQLPTSQFTFMLKFPHQGQIQSNFSVSLLITSSQPQRSKPIKLKFSTRNRTGAKFYTPNSFVIGEGKGGY